MLSGTRGKSSGWSLPLQWTKGGHAQQPYHSAAPQHPQPHSRTSAIALIPGEKGFFSCIFSIEAFSCQKPAHGVMVVLALGFPGVQQHRGHWLSVISATEVRAWKSWEALFVPDFFFFFLSQIGDALTVLNFWGTKSPSRPQDSCSQGTDAQRGALFSNPNLGSYLAACHK